MGRSPLVSRGRLAALFLSHADPGSAIPKRDFLRVASWLRSLLQDGLETLRYDEVVTTLLAAALGQPSRTLLMAAELSHGLHLRRRLADVAQGHNK